MILIFHKYHGSGNDFIIIDNRKSQFNPAPGNRQALIAAMCMRHTGIGADGLMLLEDHPESDFSMRYFNADGNEGSMCGNGSRCIAAFAFHQGIFKGNEVIFTAYDGQHRAEIKEQQQYAFRVKVGLNDTRRATPLASSMYFVDTGSPHLVIFTRNIRKKNVFAEGREIRYSNSWSEKGVNVNFAELDTNGRLQVRTYERGVENETLSCGTGVTAAAIAAWEEFPEERKPAYIIHTKGGELEVGFQAPGHDGETFSQVYLSGPAQFVYEGRIDY